MTFTVTLTKRAQKSLDKIGAPIAKKIRDHLNELKEDPFQSRPGADIVKIEGRGYPPAYRLRVGSFRAEYAVYKEQILILRVFKRSGDSDYK